MPERLILEFLIGLLGVGLLAAWGTVSTPVAFVVLFAGIHNIGRWTHHRLGDLARWWDERKWE